MPNTADYLTQLQSDRNDLADNLVTMGVAASHSETITELVPKVLDIQTGGGEQVIGTKTMATAQKIQSIVLAMPTTTTITI